MNMVPLSEKMRSNAVSLFSGGNTYLFTGLFFFFFNCWRKATHDVFLGSSLETIKPGFQRTSWPPYVGGSVLASKPSSSASGYSGGPSIYLKALEE